MLKLYYLRICYAFMPKYDPVFADHNNPFAHAMRSDGPESFRLLPGVRMAEQAARALTLDNARGIARTKSFCDFTRASQAERHDTLADLQQQQMQKAERLTSRLKLDATNRREGGQDTKGLERAVGASRVRADAEAAGTVVSGAKARERLRAAEHSRTLAEKFKGDVNLVLTLCTTPLENGDLHLECLSMAGERRWHETVPGDATFDVLKNGLTKHFKRKFQLILPNAVNITKLRGNFLLSELITAVLRLLGLTSFWIFNRAK